MNLAKTMRRKHQQVGDKTVLERWLDEATVGRLATVDEHGYPVIVPVNFAYVDGKIVFHSAREGEKLDNIRRDGKVGFEIDRVFAIVPPLVRGCQTHCFYQSIVIRGRARILDDVKDMEAKERALVLLVRKYSPDFADVPLTDVDKASVAEIAIEHISGKEDFGQTWSPELKLAVARKLMKPGDGEAAEVIARMGLTMDEVIGKGQGGAA
ncbi:MAG: pyridoxamine 5'-phosphate oxidase family protein [Chloroflexi bacterium]|nr:pyridoxamine 5'-phosphate oxidase family protein [Chloroflexota bacterium]